LRCLEKHRIIEFWFLDLLSFKYDTSYQYNVAVRCGEAHKNRISQQKEALPWAFAHKGNRSGISKPHHSTHWP
jgi:hypothetical protein